MANEYSASPCEPSDLSYLYCCLLSVPFFNDQDQFSGLDDNESAAAAAGAAAAAALAAADRDSNYRKASQVVRDPYSSK